MRNIQAFLFIFCLIISSLVHANATATASTINTTSNDKSTDDDFKFLESLDYPELQVVPRASERLVNEAQVEKEKGWLIYWPLQVSAVATLTTGLVVNEKYKDGITDQQKLDADMGSKAAIGVGLAWLGLTYYMASQESYSSDLAKIRNYKVKDKRTDLYRERMSEEALERPARMLKILTWTSVATNLLANVSAASNRPRDYNLYPVIGGLLSFMPLIFQSRYIDNYSKHLEYKRKIYTPLAYVEAWQLNGLQASAELVFAPRLNLIWSF